MGDCVAACANSINIRLSNSPLVSRVAGSHGGYLTNHVSVSPEPAHTGRMRMAHSCKRQRTTPRGAASPTAGRMWDVCDHGGSASARCDGIMGDMAMLKVTPLALPRWVASWHRPPQRRSTIIGTIPPPLSTSRSLHLPLMLQVRRRR